jgi:HAD superfamily hydrolase (TIGR01509 family)
MPKRAAILDVDGTLVDTNYQHALAWYRAFRQHDIVLPVWRVHRHIGMGGDQIVAALAGEDAEDRLGDDIRAAEKALYLAMIEEVEAIPDARELIEELRRQRWQVVLASSAKPWELDHYLDLLDARHLVDGWTSAGDVEATKPQPDLIHAALEKVGAQDGVLVGDSTWDCQAAERAGIETIGVLTGGFSAQELRDAGASLVFASISDLLSALSDTALSAPA